MGLREGSPRHERTVRQGVGGKAYTGISILGDNHRNKGCGDQTEKSCQ